MSESHSTSSAQAFTNFIKHIQNNRMTQQALSHFCQEYELQESLLLFHVWYAVSHAGRLKKQQTEKLQEVVYYWHEHIYKPLFSLYGTCDQTQHENIEPLKNDIQKELHHAVRIERQLLIEAIPIIVKRFRNPNQQLHDACYNLVNYFKLRQVNVLSQDQPILSLILQAAFPDFSGAEIIAVIEQALLSYCRDDTAFTQLSLQNV